MDKAIFLTEDDRETLQRVIEVVERRLIDNETGLANGEVHQAPEVYIAKLPGGGIPAVCVGRVDVPGSATCDIYRIARFITPDTDGTGSGTSENRTSTPGTGIVMGTGSGTGTCMGPTHLYYLEAMALEKLVFNVSLQPLTSKYAIVSRDKGGSWLSSAPPTSGTRIRGVLVSKMRTTGRAVFLSGVTTDTWNRETGDAFYLESAANPDHHAAPSGYHVNMIYDAKLGEWAVESVEMVVACLPTGELRIGANAGNTYSSCPPHWKQEGGTGSCTADVLGVGTGTYPNEDIGKLEKRVKRYAVETDEDIGTWQYTGVSFIPVQNVVGFYDEGLCTIIQTQVQFVAVACTTQEATGPCGEACGTGTA